MASSSPGLVRQAYTPPFPSQHHPCPAGPLLPRCPRRARPPLPAPRAGRTWWSILLPSSCCAPGSTGRRGSPAIFEAPACRPDCPKPGPATCFHCRIAYIALWGVREGGLALQRIQSSGILYGRPGGLLSLICTPKPPKAAPKATPFHLCSPLSFPPPAAGRALRAAPCAGAGDRGAGGGRLRAGRAAAGRADLSRAALGGRRQPGGAGEGGL